MFRISFHYEFFSLPERSGEGNVESDVGSQKLRERAHFFSSFFHVSMTFPDAILYVIPSAVFDFKEQKTSIVSLQLGSSCFDLAITGNSK